MAEYNKPINCTVCKKAVGVTHLSGAGESTWEHKRDAVCRPCYDSMSKKHDEACEYSKQLTIAWRKTQSEKNEVETELRQHQRTHEEYVTNNPDPSVYEAKIQDLENQLNKAVEADKLKASAITLANGRERKMREKLNQVRSFLEGEET